MKKEAHDLVLGAIPLGADHAITLKTLSRRTGLNTRYLQTIIQDLRRDGELIGSLSSGGIFRVDQENTDDLAHFNRFFIEQRAQALERLKTLRCMKKALA